METEKQDGFIASRTTIAEVSPSTDLGTYGGNKAMRRHNVLSFPHTPHPEIIHYVIIPNKQLHLFSTVLYGALDAL